MPDRDFLRISTSIEELLYDELATRTKPTKPKVRPFNKSEPICEQKIPSREPVGPIGDTTCTLVKNTPLVVVVHPSFPVRTFPELITYAKANPGKINYAAAGIGAPPHVAGELFKMMAGVNMVPVQYRGGAPGVADLLGGQVQVMFNVMPESIEYIRAAKLRALAVTSISRSDALPDLPVVADFLPGFEASFWAGVCAPKNTPAEIIGRINKEIVFRAA